MKSISIIAVALVYMMCFLYGCTRELSRTDPIGEKIEQLEKVSQNDGEGVLAFAIKDSIGHLTNRLEQAALARRFADKVFSIEIATCPTMLERRSYLFLVAIMTFEELQLYEDVLWCNIRVIEWCRQEHSRLCRISKKDKVALDMLNEITRFHHKAVIHYEKELLARYGVHVPPKALEALNYRFREARTLESSQPLVQLDIGEGE
jgi:hypothetical protein